MTAVVVVDAPRPRGSFSQIMYVLKIQRLWRQHCAEVAALQRQAAEAFKQLNQQFERFDTFHQLLQHGIAEISKYQHPDDCRVGLHITTLLARLGIGLLVPGITELFPEMRGVMELQRLEDTFVLQQLRTARERLPKSARNEKADGASVGAQIGAVTDQDLSLLVKIVQAKWPFKSAETRELVDGVQWIEDAYPTRLAEVVIGDFKAAYGKEQITRANAVLAIVKGNRGAITRHQLQRFFKATPSSFQVRNAISAWVANAAASEQNATALRWEADQAEAAAHRVEALIRLSLGKVNRGVLAQALDAAGKRIFHLSQAESRRAKLPRLKELVARNKYYKSVCGAGAPVLHHLLRFSTSITTMQRRFRSSRFAVHEARRRQQEFLETQREAYRQYRATPHAVEHWKLERQKEFALHSFHAVLTAAQEREADIRLRALVNRSSALLLHMACERFI